MHPLRRNTVCLILILWLVPMASAQESSYALRLQVFKEAPTSIKCSPDGSLLLAGFSDGSFRVLDPETFQVTLEISNAHFKAVHAVDISPNMDLLLTAGHNTLRLWDPGGEKIHTWSHHATTIWNAEISRDGKWVVSSAYNKTFLLWDLPDRSLLTPLRGHEDVCLSTCISPDNKWIASGGKDQIIRIWDLENREVNSSMQGPGEMIYDLEFSPDSRLLAAASQDKSVRIYHVDSTELLHILKGHTDRVLKVAFSPDGKYLLSGSADHSLILWDVQKAEKIHEFLDHGGPVTGLAFHPGGLFFYSISAAGELIRWPLHSEIFVLKYYEEAYLGELSANPVFGPRQKGESKKDFQNRQSRAAPLKKEILDRYYRLYLQERDLMPKNIP